VSQLVLWVRPGRLNRGLQRNRRIPEHRTGLESPEDLEDRWRQDLPENLDFPAHQMVQLDQPDRQVQLIPKILEFQALRTVPEVQRVRTVRLVREIRRVLVLQDRLPVQRILSRPEVLEPPLSQVCPGFLRCPDLQLVLEIPVVLVVLESQVPQGCRRNPAALAALELLENRKIPETQLFQESLRDQERHCFQPDLPVQSPRGDPSTQENLRIPSLPAARHSRVIRLAQRVPCHPGLPEIPNFPEFQKDQPVQRVRRVLALRVDQRFQEFRGSQQFPRDPWNRCIRYYRGCH